jgi:type II secretory pathway pseudopilin PulG
MAAHLSETDRPRADHRAEAGYTLIEAIVMLAIVAMVSVLVLDSIRVATSSGIRIERVARDAVNRHLDIASLRNALQATVIAYRDSEETFQGTAARASGYTTSGLGLSGHIGSRFAVELDTSGPMTQFVYSEGEVRWVVAEWPGTESQLEYWSTDNGGEWVTQWPGRLEVSQYFSPLPPVIRVVSSPNEPSFELVFAFSNTAPPPLRVEDIMGTSVP